MDVNSQCNDDLRHRKEVIEDLKGISGPCYYVLS